MPDKQALETAMSEQAAEPSPGPDLAANAAYLQHATERLGDPRLASMMRARAIMEDPRRVPPQSPPRSFGAPLGAQAPVNATERNVARAPTDEQVKAAYQQYMRQVIAAAHAHFHEHVQRVRGSSADSPPTATPALMGTGAASQAGDRLGARGQQIDQAVSVRPLPVVAPKGDPL